MTTTTKSKLAAISLLLASFFLPFGYDALFALIMKLTGSFWITDAIFYCISAFFFGLYFYFSGNNPLRELKDDIVKLLKKRHATKKSLD